MTAMFDTKKTSRMKTAIAAMETLVKDKRAESDDAEGRLREKLEDARTEFARTPLAGSLVWRGRRDV